MTKDKHKTLVIFKKFPEGDVIALMPEETWNNSQITSYMRIGQHGGASPELVDELQDATKQERKSLLKELQNIGYNVKEGN